MKSKPIAKIFLPESGIMSYIPIEGNVSGEVLETIEALSQLDALERQIDGFLPFSSIQASTEFAPNVSGVGISFNNNKGQESHIIVTFQGGYAFVSRERKLEGAAPFQSKGIFPLVNENSKRLFFGQFSQSLFEEMRKSDLRYEYHLGFEDVVSKKTTLIDDALIIPGDFDSNSSKLHELVLNAFKFDSFPAELKRIGDNLFSNEKGELVSYSVIKHFVGIEDMLSANITNTIVYYGLGTLTVMTNKFVNEINEKLASEKLKFEFNLFDGTSVLRGEDNENFMGFDEVVLESRIEKANKIILDLVETKCKQLVMGTIA